MNWREKVEEILKKCWGLLPLLVVLICVALVKAIEALTGDTLRSVPSLILMGFGICSVAVARQYPPYFRRYSPSGFGCSFENHHPHPVVCAGGVLGGHERSGNGVLLLPGTCGHVPGREDGSQRKQLLGDRCILLPVQKPTLLWETDGKRVVWQRRI